MHVDARTGSDKPTATGLLDLSAVGLSVLCMLHCLALPALALTLPMLSGLAEVEWFHFVFLAIAAPIALLVFADIRTRSPNAWWMLALAIVGLCLMLAGALELPSPAWDRPLTLVGGVLLASAHLANWRRLHALSRCAEDHSLSVGKKR